VRAWPYVLLYVALYAAFGVASPYWPKLFESKGLAPQQIGWILAAALLVRLAAGPLIGRLADRLASLRLVLASCIVAAAAAAAAYMSADTFWLVLLIALAQAAALAPTTSLADALTVNAAGPRTAGKRFEYGRVRGAASAAFLVGTLVIGQLIAPADLRPIVWMNAALLIVAAAATALLPASTPEPEPRAAALAAAKVRTLLELSPFRIVIAVSALVYGSHALYDAFAVIRWSAAGLPAPVISLLWAEAVAGEVVVFFLVGPWLLDRLGVRGAALLAATAGIVRWCIMGFTNSVVVLSVLQPLHGLTFALLHLACMRVIGNVVPSAMAATSQALYAFGAGLMTAALTSLSGTLYGDYGGPAFLAMAALCIIALPLAWWGFADPRPFAPSPRSSARALQE
jgi:MFS transporter, PPP family, 3-phenylpropionic acid transporter